jgi:hypothetical protein
LSDNFTVVSGHRRLLLRLVEGRHVDEAVNEKDGRRVQFVGEDSEANIDERKNVAGNEMIVCKSTLCYEEEHSEILVLRRSTTAIICSATIYTATPPRSFFLVKHSVSM